MEELKQLQPSVWDQLAAPTVDRAQRWRPNFQRKRHMHKPRRHIAGGLAVATLAVVTAMLFLLFRRAMQLATQDTRPFKQLTRNVGLPSFPDISSAGSSYGVCQLERRYWTCQPGASHCLTLLRPRSVRDIATLQGSDNAPLEDAYVPEEPEPEEASQMSSRGSSGDPDLYVFPSVYDTNVCLGEPEEDPAQCALMLIVKALRSIVRLSPVDVRS